MLCFSPFYRQYRIVHRCADLSKINPRHVEQLTVATFEHFSSSVEDMIDEADEVSGAVQSMATPTGNVLSIELNICRKASASKRPCLQSYGVDGIVRCTV